MIDVNVMSLPVQCTLRALVPLENVRPVMIILEKCFPDSLSRTYGSVQTAGEADGDAAAHAPPPRKLPGATHVFRSEKVPVSGIRALSRRMPDSQFWLEYEVADTDEDAPARSGIVVFLAGELVRQAGDPTIWASDDEDGASECAWLRGVAEKILESAHRLAMSVQHGFHMDWKERGEFNLLLEGFAFLKGLLDQSDQRLLDATSAAFRAEYENAKRRSRAADAAVTLMAFVTENSDSGAAPGLLNAEDSQQLRQAAELLRNVARGIPAESERV
jgi:hypothetical protein